jgi:uncharacterized Zn finger protein
MAQFSKTWWGKRFIEALEEFSDSARLSRGRSYARNGKIKEYVITNNQITAFVRGSVNPYFGVYKEPLYNINIEIKAISSADWSKVISYLGSKASLISKLLMNEVPDNIEEAFAQLNLHLLPHNRQDFKTNCSCPDWENPCKHIAGVYYLVASELDRDPFLVFELRGISRLKLQEELAKSPLGKVLSKAIAPQEILPEPVSAYYTKPKKVQLPESISAQDFWLPQKRLPQTVEAASPASIPAITIKKAGDFPPFWNKDFSFLEVMEDLYGRVRTKT